MRVWFAQQCNSTTAAAKLFTHRNTVVRRLARAQELLPVELSRNAIAVAAALEYQHWQGSRSPTVYRFPPNVRCRTATRAVPRIEVVHLIGDRGWGEVGVGEGVPGHHGASSQRPSWWRRLLNAR